MEHALSAKQAASIILVAVIIQLLVAFAVFGPTVTSNPQDLPLGFVNADAGDEATAHIGDLLAAGIVEMPRPETAWTTYASEAELRAAMARRDVYGGIVLPSDLTERMNLLPDAQAQPVQVLVLINEGMHPVGAQAARALLTAIVDGSARQLAQQLLASLAAADAAVTADQVLSIASPLRAQLEMVHSPGDSLGRAQVALALVLSGSVLAIVSWLLGIAVDGGIALYGLLALISLTFLLLQSTVLNWLGFAGWPLLVILWLFGPSVLAVPPEFLAGGYRIAVYSWIPFRYSAEALQGLLFFDAGAGETGRNVWIILLYGLFALAAVLGSVRRLVGRDLTTNPLARRFRGAQPTQ